MRPVDRPVERFLVDPGQRLRERLAQARIEMPPEGEAPADQVLPEARLGLVDAGRRAVPQRRAVDLGAHALVVHGMSGFVDRAEEAFVEEVARDPGRDADVARPEACRKRMLRDVLEAPLEVLAEPLDDSKRVRRLEVRWETAMPHR